MANVNLTQNFKRIFEAFERRGEKPTNFAKTIGYTTTSQLNSVLDGSSQLSTKAIISLIENLNINPNFLFLSQGDMFLDDAGDSELIALHKELNIVRHNHSEAVKTAMELAKKYDDLVEITSAAIKHYKAKLGEE